MSENITSAEVIKVSERSLYPCISRYRQLQCYRGVTKSAPDKTEVMASSASLKRAAWLACYTEVPHWLVDTAPKPRPSPWAAALSSMIPAFHELCQEILIS